MYNYPGRVVSKFQFSKLFSKAWSKGISNICAGFRNTGISPLNCSAILSRLPPSSVVHAPEFSSTDDEISGAVTQKIKQLQWTEHFQDGATGARKCIHCPSIHHTHFPVFSRTIRLFQVESLMYLHQHSSEHLDLQQSNSQLEVLEDSITELRKCKQ